MRHWIVEDSSLLLVDDNGHSTVPSSAFVYDALGYGETTLPDVSNPCEDLPDIKFSKRGARLSLRLEMDSNGACRVDPLLTRMSKKLDASNLSIPVPEHIITDMTWAFISDGLEEANACLTDTGICNFGSISLSQYCRLISLEKAGQMPPTEIVGERVEPTLLDERPPASLQASLYPYQQNGFSWLSFMSRETHGCILGDEMGLGKTLQVIALLLARHEAGLGTSLVIAPVSLLENWRRELARFAPSLSVLVHHGSGRAGYWKRLTGYDVVVLSYGSAVSDRGMLRMHEWDCLVLDEAQAIKNPDSRRSAAVKDIPHTFGIAVSGTPFENHVSDVWSIMQFVEPSVLGDRAMFNATYPDDLTGAAALEPAITPLLLRRTVDEVAGDLPERIESNVPLVLSEKEAEGYEAVRRECQANAASAGATLAVLNKLRMFCTHPLTVGYGEDAYSSSIKFQQACLILEEIILRGEKVLVFTSYRKMIEIFLAYIPKRFRVPAYAIDGSTPPAERQPIVDGFSGITSAAVLILNPTAAGTGLNITAACNVIHYNLEWNPAKEDQATARAHRRGQTRPVRVYRLYYVGTVEEVIFERMATKREMAASAIVGTRGIEADRMDILRALTLTPAKG